MLKRILTRIGEFQYRHAKEIVLITIVFTSLMILGLPKVELQTNLKKELPPHLPVVELDEDIGYKFGDIGVFLIVIEVDKKSEIENGVEDIRDPRVIEMVRNLHDLLSKERKVTRVISFAPFFPKTPSSISEVQRTLELFPQAKNFFNKFYTTTVMIVYTQGTPSEREVKEIVNTVNDDIASVAIPPGIKVTLTGNAVLRTILMDYLVSDAIKTTTIASLIILLLLLLLYKIRGALIFFPILLGLIWTIGTTGWLGIPLTIDTVGIGAMIIGLGIEYSVFILSRYTEERKKGKSQLDSLRIVIPAVGSAVAGSGTTTITGFLALLFASMPWIQHVGETLALGIFYCLIAALIANPAFLIVVEDINQKLRGGKGLEFG